MNKGIFFTALSATLYGCIGYFWFQLKASGMSVLDLCFWRFLASAALLVPFLLQSFVKKPRWQSLLYTFVLGGVFYGSSTLCYFMASESLGTGLAMVIFFTYPIYVVLISSVIARTLPNRVTWLALVLICTGCFLIAYEKNMHFDARGVGLAFLSALGYGIYVAFSKKTSRSLSPLVGTFVVCLGNSMLFLLMIPLLQEEGFSLPSSAWTWLNVGLFAIVGTILPVLFLLIGMKYISADRAAILSVLEPVTVLAVGLLVLGEVFSVRQFIGALIILASALLISIKKDDTMSLASCSPG